MKLIDLEKAIGYAKEKDYIKTYEQEEAVREVFALATVEAIPIDVLDKIKTEIRQEIIPRNSDQYCNEAMWQNFGLRMALKVIDIYKEEGSDKE